MLLNGHTEMEIQLATVQAGKTRKQRLETIQEIKEKVKSLMSAAAAAAGKVRPLSNNNHRMATPSPVSHQLPPSPIIPRRSPVRACAENPEKLRHLRFPRISDSRILSPRCQIRKRSVPIDLGDELFQGDVLTPHVYSNTPKRLCSPRNPALSPHPENFCASMRFPARVRSPTADSRPLIKPRRLASPPPLMLSQQHSPPPRAS